MGRGAQRCGIAIAGVGLCLGGFLSTSALAGARSLADATDTIVTATIATVDHSVTAVTINVARPSTVQRRTSTTIRVQRARPKPVAKAPAPTRRHTYVPPEPKPAATPVVTPTTGTRSLVASTRTRAEPRLVATRRHKVHAKKRHHIAAKPKPKLAPKPKPAPRHSAPAALPAFPPVTAAAGGSSSSHRGFVVVLLALALIAFGLAAIPEPFLARSRVLMPLAAHRGEAAALGITLSLATVFALLLVGL